MKLPKLKPPDWITLICTLIITIISIKNCAFVDNMPPWKIKEPKCSLTGILKTNKSCFFLCAKPFQESITDICIPKGTRVEIIYYVKDNYEMIEGRKGIWCKVKYGYKEGFIFGGYLIAEPKMCIPN